MAYQIQPIYPEEVKEINREDCSDRLQAEIRELALKLEKLNKKLAKKKNELETERTNSKTLRQLIQELNNKVQLLERAPPSPLANPGIHTPAMHPVISEELVHKLVIDKTGLESQVYEQKREIDSLNSELISYRNKLTLKTESHQQESAANQEIVQARLIKSRDTQILYLQAKEKNLNDKIEQLKSDNKDLDNVFQVSERERRTLEKQTDVLHTQIDSLTENKRDKTQKIQELEGSNENAIIRSKDLEMQLGESKGEYMKLEMRGEETSSESNQLIGQLRKELDTLKDELKSERQNSEIGKLLINKLNSDIQNFEKGNAGQNTADLERQLDESQRARIETELKLGDMATQIANRNARIHELEQNVGILQNKSQVAQTTSTPLMPTNPSKTKDDKKQAKLSKDQTKQKQAESSGATPGATFFDLTPQIAPVVNKSGKSPFKISIRPGMSAINVVKLKSLPNPLEYQATQVILSVGTQYELGVLVAILEVPGRVGFKIVVQKYVGIKLNNPVGNSNGEFRTKRYFQCEPNCGIFVPFEDVLIAVL